MNWFVCMPLAAALLAGSLAAQEFGADRVTVAGSFAPPTAAPGASVELVVKVTPEPGWHVYGTKEQVGIPTTLKVTEPGVLTVAGEAAVPDGTPHQSGPLTSWWLEEPFEVRQRMTVPADARPGAVEVAFELRYMACTPRLCDPEATATGKATLTIAAAADGAPETAAPEPARFGDARIDVEARFVPARVKANGRAKLVLRVTPALGWHVYGKKNQIGPPIGVAKVEGAGVQAEGSARVPDGEPHEMGSLTTWWLAEPFEIEQDVRVAPGTAPGVVPVEVTISYMACTETNCDPQTELQGKVELVVEEGEAEPEPADGEHRTDAGAGAAANGPGTGRGPRDGALAAKTAAEAGLLGVLLLLAVGAGLFALVMPCTYPMIPITISFFTKQAAARGGSALSLSLLYGAGIVLMFVLIGVVIGEPIQRFAANPVFNLLVAAAFLVFGVALLGLINLQPPQSLNALAGKASARGGYAGVFALGALLVVTSFTCTAPVIGGLLGGTATLQGEFVTVTRGETALAMAVFGLTMAVPFVVLSQVPGKLKTLPKSGEWMNTLKVFFGFVELAAALKFLSNADIVWQWRALPREVFFWLWAALFAVAGFYLLGMIRLKGEDGAIGPGRLVSGLGTMLFSAYCVFGALGNPMDFVMTAFAPNYSVAVAHDGGSKSALAPRHVIVEDDHDRALAVAKADGKLLFINFTGVT